MKIRQPSFDYLRLLKGFWSICNYQVNVGWVYGIFETGLIFDNIFATVDLTEIFHGGIIWFYIEILQMHICKLF